MKAFGCLQCPLSRRASIDSVGAARLAIVSLSRGAFDPAELRNRSLSKCQELPTHRFRNLRLSARQTMVSEPACRRTLQGNRGSGVHFNARTPRDRRSPFRLVPSWSEKVHHVSVRLVSSVSIAMLISVVIFSLVLASASSVDDHPLHSIDHPLRARCLGSPSSSP